MTDALFFVYSADPDSGEANITVFVPGKLPLSANSDHAKFDEIKELAEEGDASCIDLFDLGQVAETRFDSLGDRVTVRNGTIYLDGDAVDNALTRQVVRFIDEDQGDWVALVNFFESVQANPNEHSRTQLYEWLDRHDFPITREGYFIAYKGVADAGDGKFQSISTGSAIVNGEPQSGAIVQGLGDEVTMPRSKVQHDPSQGCSVGLHVGTYEYATGWARGALLKVLIDPRDVVSVPTDCNAQKVRVCRYTILDTIDHKIESAYDPYVSDDYDDEYDDVGYDDEPEEDEGCDCEYCRVTY